MRAVRAENRGQKPTVLKSWVKLRVYVSLKQGLKGSANKEESRTIAQEFPSPYIEPGTNEVTRVSCARRHSAPTASGPTYDGERFSAIGRRPGCRFHDRHPPVL